MKIRLLIRRKDGSSVKLNGMTYLFNGENDHVANVEDDDHAAHLLGIEPRVFVEEIEGNGTATSGDDHGEKKPEGSDDEAGKASPAAPEETTKRARKPRASKDLKE